MFSLSGQYLVTRCATVHMLRRSVACQSCFSHPSVTIVRHYQSDRDRERRKYDHYYPPDFSIKELLKEVQENTYLSKPMKIVKDAFFPPDVGTKKLFGSMQRGLKSIRLLRGGSPMDLWFHRQISGPTRLRIDSGDRPKRIQLLGFDFLKFLVKFFCFYIIMKYFPFAIMIWIFALICTLVN